MRQPRYGRRKHFIGYGQGIVVNDEDLEPSIEILPQRATNRSDKELCTLEGRE